MSHNLHKLQEKKLHSARKVSYHSLLDLKQTTNMPNLATFNCFCVKWDLTLEAIFSRNKTLHYPTYSSLFSLPVTRLFTINDFFWHSSISAPIQWNLWDNIFRISRESSKKVGWSKKRSLWKTASKTLKQCCNTTSSIVLTVLVTAC